MRGNLYIALTIIIFFGCSNNFEKKYTSVEGCKLLAEKKSKAVAFNLDTSEGKCYLLKSVTGSTNSASVVSGS